MNAYIKHIITLPLVISTMTLLTYSQQQNEVPAETMARMMKLGEQLATPNSNHFFLEKFAGQWKTSSTVMGMEPSSGSASYSMILGNRFLDGMHDGDFMGVPFIGRLTLGYDNYKHKFVASFIDNLGTSMRSAEGLLDRTGKKLSLWGEMDEWLTDEHDKMVLYQYQIVDSNTILFEIHDLALEKDSKVIEVTYSRMTDE